MFLWDDGGVIKAVSPSTTLPGFEQAAEFGLELKRLGLTSAHSMLSPEVPQDMADELPTTIEMLGDWGYRLICLQEACAAVHNRYDHTAQRELLSRCSQESIAPLIDQITRTIAQISYWAPPQNGEIPQIDVDTFRSEKQVFLASNPDKAILNIQQICTGLAESFEDLDVKIKHLLLVNEADKEAFITFLASRSNPEKALEAIQYKANERQEAIESLQLSLSSLLPTLKTLQTTLQTTLQPSSPESSQNSNDKP